MKTDHEIRKNVMRRVYMMYWLRQVTSPALRLGVLGGALLVLAQVVSIKDVVANAFGTSGFSGLTTFLYSAVTTTESSVLILTMLATALVLWFIADQIKKTLHVGAWQENTI